jgi:hypothetical protein
MPLTVTLQLTAPVPIATCFRIGCPTAPTQYAVGQFEAEPGTSPVEYTPRGNALPAGWIEEQMQDGSSRPLCPACQAILQQIVAPLAPPTSTTTP